MKRVIAAVSAFILGQAFTWTAAWMHGFNFDHRGANVGLAFVMGILLSCGFAVIAAMCPIFDEK